MHFSRRQSQIVQKQSDKDVQNILYPVTRTLYSFQINIITFKWNNVVGG